MNKIHQQERHFAAVLILISTAFGLWPLLDGEGIKPAWLIIAASLSLIAWLMPVILKPIVTIWIKIGHVLGFINSRILLALAFYVVVTPLALLFKLIGRDALALRWQNKKKSFWHIQEKSWSPDSFKNQF